jgi:hypothetical protein
MGGNGRRFFFASCYRRSVFGRFGYILVTARYAACGSPFGRIGVNGEYLRKLHHDAFHAFNMLDREGCRTALAKMAEVLEPPTKTAELQLSWVDEANRCIARGCMSPRFENARLCWAHGGDHPALNVKTG